MAAYTDLAAIAAIAETAAKMTDDERFARRCEDRLRFEHSAFSYIYYRYGPHVQCSREEAIRLFSAYIAQMMVLNRPAKGQAGAGG